MKSISEVLDIRKNWLTHVMFIIGALLVGISQYNFSSLEIRPYIFGESGFLQSMPDMLNLNIPDPPAMLANYLLLLIGAFLLVSALRKTEAIPKKKDPTLPTTDIRGFSKGHLFLVRLLGLALISFLLWQLYNQSEEPYLVVIWLAAILVFAYLVAQLDLQNSIFLGPNLRRLDILWLAGLFLLGLIIGMYRLQSLPAQFVGDEGSFWDLASSFANGTIRPLFFDNGVYSFPNMSSVGQALVLLIFGASVWAWRFSSLLAGLLTIIPLYLLARELFDRTVAVVSCIAMATLEYFLAFSRLGYNNSQSLFPVTLALYLVVVAVRRNSMLYFYLAGCAAGLGFYTYTASRSALVIIVLFMLTLLFQNRQALANGFKAIVVMSLAWCIVAAPLLIFTSLHSPDSVNLKLKENVFFRTDYAGAVYPEDKFLDEPSTILSEDRSFFFNPRMYALLLTRGFVRTLLSFQIPGVKTGHFTTAPLAGIAGAAFFMVGMVISLTGFRERRYYLLLYWFAANVFLLSTFNTSAPSLVHLVSMAPLIALWTSLGLVATINGLSYLYLHNRKLRAILIATLTVGIALSGLYSYFVKMPIIYRPELEQIMSWSALYAQDEKMVYVYDIPEQSEMKPYVMQYVLPGFPYRTSSPDQLATQLSGKTVVFFPPGLAPQVEAILQSSWSNIPAERTFYSAEGLAILKGAANFPTSFGPATDLVSTLSDSYLRPGLWLILLAVVVLVFAIGFRVAWLEHTPPWTLRTYTWITAEPPPA